jgi:protein gp37
VSEGCDNCYAETFAERWRGVPGHPFEQGFDVRLWPERLELPLRRRKPTRYFVNSMSDLFIDPVPEDNITDMYGTSLTCTGRDGRVWGLVSLILRTWLEARLR